MNKILKIALALGLAVAMLIVGTGTTLADSNKSVGEVKGVITIINTTVTSKTITITTKEGKDFTLKVDTSTVITKTGIGNISITDLAINDKVTANYDQTSNVASKITVIQPLGKRHSFEGTIKSISGSTLVVTTKKGDQTFNVSSVTKYFIPGVKNATLANFKVGNKVSVSTVEVTTNGIIAQIAQRINLIPAKPIKAIRTGTVIAYTPGSSITIQDKKGLSSTFIINADTKILNKRGAAGINTGDQVTISASRNPADSQFTAKLIRDFGIKQTKPNAQQNEHGKDNGKNK